MKNCLLFAVIVACLFPANSFAQVPDSISIATWNLEWFFDDFTGDNGKGLPKDLSAPSKDEWEWKLNAVAKAVAEMQPTILALQEVEDRDAVWDLCQRLRKNHNLQYRYAFVGGYEFATEQDVAVIYQSGCVEYSRREQTQEMFATKEFYNLGKHIFARFQWGEGDSKQELLICNVHLRAGADRENIRQRQCRLVHHWLANEISEGKNVVALGDFNTEHNFDKVPETGDLSIAQGKETGSPDDDLFDLHKFLDEDQRDTHLIGRQFDRILVSPSLLEDKAGMDMSFSSIVCRKDLVVVGDQDKDHFNVFYDIPQAERDISDHYPVMAEFLIK